MALSAISTRLPRMTPCRSGKLTVIPGKEKQGTDSVSCFVSVHPESIRSPADLTSDDLCCGGQRIRVLFRKPVVYVNGPVKQGKQRGQDVNSGFLSFKALTRETNCFTGEDDCHWCFHFEDGKFLEYSGNTFFEYDIPCCPKKDCIFSDGERCRASLINSLYNKAVPWERSHLAAPPTQLVSPFRIQEAVFMTITCCCSFPQGIEQRHPQKAV